VNVQEAYRNVGIHFKILPLNKSNCVSDDRKRKERKSMKKEK
jgi:hypothetical protein